MTAQRPSKETIYRWIRVGGLLTLIPITLCVGPIAGYFAGKWLAQQFHLPSWIPVASAALGFIGGVLETIKAIKVALKSTEEP